MGRWNVINGMIFVILLVSIIKVCVCDDYDNGFVRVIPATDMLSNRFDERTVDDTSLMVDDRNVRFAEIHDDLPYMDDEHADDDADDDTYENQKFLYGSTRFRSVDTSDRGGGSGRVEIREDDGRTFVEPTIVERVNRFADVHENDPPRPPQVVTQLRTTQHPPTHVQIVDDNGTTTNNHTSQQSLTPITYHTPPQVKNATVRAATTVKSLKPSTNNLATKLPIVQKAPTSAIVRREVKMKKVPATHLLWPPTSPRTSDALKDATQYMVNWQQRISTLSAALVPNKVIVNGSSAAHNESTSTVNTTTTNNHHQKNITLTPAQNKSLSAEQHNIVKGMQSAIDYRNAFEDEQNEIRAQFHTKMAVESRVESTRYVQDQKDTDKKIHDVMNAAKETRAKLEDESAKQLDRNMRTERQAINAAIAVKKADAYTKSTNTINAAQHQDFKIQQQARQRARAMIDRANREASEYEIQANAALKAKKARLVSETHRKGVEVLNNAFSAARLLKTHMDDRHHREELRKQVKKVRFAAERRADTKHFRSRVQQRAKLFAQKREEGVKLHFARTQLRAQEEGKKQFKVYRRSNPPMQNQIST